MNIQVQCCALVILLLLIYFTVKNRRVGLYTESLFIKIVLLNFFSVVMDILSIIAITYQDYISGFVLRYICKTYVTSVVWVGFFALIYALSDIFSKEIYIKMERKYLIFALIGNTMIYLLPIHFYHNGRVIYSYGYSVMATYFFAVLFILNTLYYMMYYRDTINAMRRRAVMLWLLIWSVASVIQFLFNELLLVGYASSLGIMILFYLIENPEANLDKQFGCFNSRTLMLFFKQAFINQKSYSILAVSFSYLHDSGVNAEQVNETIVMLSDIYMRDKSIKVFKTIDGMLILVFESRDHLDKVLNELKANQISVEKGKCVKMMVQPQFVVMYDSGLAKEENELFRILKDHILQYAVNNKDKITYVDAEMVERVRTKEETYVMLTDALENDRVEIFIQPIFSREEKLFSSAEVLARIRKEDGTIVSPGVFIEVAEEYGLIKQLGEVVFQKTCEFMQENDLTSYGVQYMEINLSVVQCESWHLADKYIEIMRQHGLPSKTINLEITESASIRTRNVVLSNMQKLMDFGVTFSLDDFGNGNSNLNYIMDMPFVNVKLDMKMVKAYFKSEKSRLVVLSTIKMIHNLGLKIIAEGVETAEEFEEMLDISVDYIQGYYFSKPLCRDDYLSYMKENHHKYRV